LSERKVAEKDALIAQLMQEGEKLSRNELKYLGGLKKLRSRIQDDESARTESQKKLQQVEKVLQDTKVRAERAEDREKSVNDRITRLERAEKEAELLRSEKNAALRDIQELKKRLVEEERHAEEADKRAQTAKVEEQKKAIEELKDELSNARIEKKLIEDRVKSEMKEVKEAHGRQLEKSRLAELELKTELQVR
jgi:hypothetical protein